MYDPEYITCAEERGEQINEDRLDDLSRCEAHLDAAQKHAAQLEQILDACEAANFRHLARIEKLEQLCNDLFNHVCAEQIGARVNMQQFVELSERMDDLGLMEEFHD